MSTYDKSEVRVSVAVPLDQEQAFALFVEGFDRWWPSDGSHSLAEATGFVMEPHPEGRWGELGPAGFQPWGRVLEVDRPRRILLAWQLSPEFEYDADRARQTEVEVTFEPTSDGTEVRLEHRGFEVWGDPGGEMRASLEGWGPLLERYAERAVA